MNSLYEKIIAESLKTDELLSHVKRNRINLMDLKNYILLNHHDKESLLQQIDFLISRHTKRLSFIEKSSAMLFPFGYTTAFTENIDLREKFKQYGYRKKFKQYHYYSLIGILLYITAISLIIYFL
ncbi:MAG: hypothetical protein NXI09_15580 [Bacteroidetes bacterium]|nr:hypothetical protein [Bacteroidota bacterium]